VLCRQTEYERIQGKPEGQAAEGQPGEAATEGKQDAAEATDTNKVQEGQQAEQQQGEAEAGQEGDAKKDGAEQKAAGGPGSPFVFGKKVHNTPFKPMVSKRFDMGLVPVAEVA
jgi:hypothetical protein